MNNRPGQNSVVNSTVVAGALSLLFVCIGSLPAAATPRQIANDEVLATLAFPAAQDLAEQERAVPAAVLQGVENPAEPDTVMVQDEIYNRPFVSRSGRTAVGGYVEGNTNAFATDGLREGFSFELRRFNIFLFSQISEQIRLISELEFEHGTEEIALETALIDFRVSPALILRGGILLPPIGAYNTNHDSPQWEFVNRPLVSTQIIPTTLSEVGAGLHGKVYPGNMMVSYDMYLTNGLGDGVVLNSEGRTHLASGKHESQFAEDNNGSPAFSGRLAVGRPGLGELGVSYYGGVYNRYSIEGDIIDKKRRLALYAVDYRLETPAFQARGEVAYATVDVQDDLKELFAQRQWGGHLDLIVPVWRTDVLAYRDAVLNLILRLERVDYNMGSFSSTGARIYDETSAIVPGLSFRPTDETVFRINFIRQWSRDLVGNPASVTSGIQVGFATYF